MSGYTPCDQCHYVPPEVDGPPFARVVKDPMTWHRSTCPTVPQLSRERRMRLEAFMDDVASCQRRAWAKAQTYVIG
jgi:hypothetical protein